MMSIVNTVLVLCALGQFGAKAELRIYLEDTSIEAIDPMYFDVENTEVYIDESTIEYSLTTNVSIIREIPTEADGHFKLLGLSMGKYNLPTGVDFTMKFCDALEDPIIFGRIAALLGFADTVCPPPPGVYFNEGYVVSVDTLPEDFPENKYLGVIEISFEGKPIIQLHVYIDVQ